MSAGREKRGPPGIGGKTVEATANWIPRFWWSEVGWSEGRRVAGRWGRGDKAGQEFGRREGEVNLTGG